YTLMFLKHSNEALEIEKFKRARENKIKFEKIDSSVQKTSSLKPYVPTVILEKVIISLEDEVAKNHNENEYLKSTVVDFTTFQNLRVQVKDLQSDDDLKFSVEELTKACEIAEVTLR
ncbi:hypothetical protein Tco_1398653, partial [Tanacetum coccineum]